MRPSDLTAALTESRLELERALEGVPERLWGRSPPSGGWSARDVVEHLVIVEARVGAGIRRGWSELSARELGPWDAEAIDPAKLEGLAEATTPVTSPEGSRPSGQGTLPELLEALAERRGRLLNLLAEMAPYDTSAAGWEHFAFGRLNLAEWVLFLALHERRHAGQLRRIAAAFGASGASGASGAFG